MIIHECIPCQHGNHDSHRDVVEGGTEGLIGSGWECPCRGECRDRRPTLPTPSPSGQAPPEARRFRLSREPGGQLYAYQTAGQPLGQGAITETVAVEDVPASGVSQPPARADSVAWILWGDRGDGHGNLPLGAYVSREVALEAETAAGEHPNAGAFKAFLVTPWPLRPDPTLNFRMELPARDGGAPSEPTPEQVEAGARALALFDSGATEPGEDMGWYSDMFRSAWSAAFAKGEADG